MEHPTLYSRKKIQKNGLHTLDNFQTRKRKLNQRRNINKMEEAQTNQPQLGTWDKLSTEEVERKPKIDFEVGKQKTVKFLEDIPAEFQGEKGAYYLFNVEEDGTEKVIMTSAWTLLRGIKMISPLKDKVAIITKVMENGKQKFVVELSE